MQTLEKGGLNLRNFTKRGVNYKENTDVEAKIRV